MVTRERDPFLWLAPRLEGDEASYQEFADGLLRRLKRYFASNGCAMADDLASESLLRLTRRLAEGEPEQGESEDQRTRFLFGIAKNVLWEWRRRPSGRETNLRDGDGPEYILPPIDLIRKECLEILRQTISQTLTQLSAVDREILKQTLLNADGHQSLAALAKEKGIQAPAMRQRGRRSRIRFEETLLASERIEELLRCLGLKRGNP